MRHQTHGGAGAARPLGVPLQAGDEEEVGLLRVGGAYCASADGVLWQPSDEAE